VLVFVSVYCVIDSVRKLLDTPSYREKFTSIWNFAPQDTPLHASPCDTAFIYLFIYLFILSFHTSSYAFTSRCCTAARTWM